MAVMLHGPQPVASRGPGSLWLYRHWVVEEPRMIPFLIALAVACVAFWKVAARILVIVVMFLIVSGVIMVIQDLHHMR